MCHYCSASTLCLPWHHVDQVWATQAMEAWCGSKILSLPLNQLIIKFVGWVHFWYRGHTKLLFIAWVTNSWCRGHDQTNKMILLGLKKHGFITSVTFHQPLSLEARIKAMKLLSILPVSTAYQIHFAQSFSETRIHISETRDGYNQGNLPSVII